MSISAELVEEPGAEPLGAPVQSWQWTEPKAANSRADQSFIVLTDTTLFIAPEIDSEAARKLLMAIDEGDFQAISARSSAANRRREITISQLVEVNWVPKNRRGVFHTSNGQPLVVEFPSEELTVEVCAQIARTIGTGARKVTDLGRFRAASQSVRPFWLAILVAVAVAFVAWNANDYGLPSPMVWAGCGALVGTSALLAYQQFASRIEKYSVEVNRPPGQRL